jgi:uncharacterized membrane protein
MNQPVGRGHRIDNRAADQAVQDDAAEQPRQPGTPAQEQPEQDRLWTVFQVDQQRISALDTIMMTIRGWTVTLVSAIVGFSLSQHHRNLLLVAMVGTVFFGLLDIGYRRTQLLHASRASKVEQDLLPEKYRLRSDHREGLPRLTVHRSRYHSSISFYLVLLILLLLLWIAT